MERIEATIVEQPFGWTLVTPTRIVDCETGSEAIEEARAYAAARAPSLMLVTWEPRTRVGEWVARVLAEVV